MSPHAPKMCQPWRFRRLLNPSINFPVKYHPELVVLVVVAVSASAAAVLFMEELHLVQAGLPNGLVQRQLQGQSL